MDVLRIQRILFLTVWILAALSSNCFAISVRVERTYFPDNALLSKADRLPTRLQQAVSFGKEVTIYSRNTNFFCEPSAIVWLGYFQKKSSAEDLICYELFNQAVKRLRFPSEDFSEEKSIHGIQRYIGVFEVSGRDGYQDTVERLINGVCEAYAEVKKPLTAVRVELKSDVLHLSRFEGGRLISKRTISISNLKCSKDPSAWKCLIPGFGWAALSIQ